MNTVDLRPTNTRLVVPRDTNVALRVTLDHGGTAPNITLDTVVLTVKTSVGATTPVFELTNAPGGHTTPASGITTFALTPAHTATAPVSASVRWYYEIRRIVAATLEEYVYAAGALDVVPTV